MLNPKKNGKVLERVNNSVKKMAGKVGKTENYVNESGKKKKTEGEMLKKKNKSEII